MSFINVTLFKRLNETNDITKKRRRDVLDTGQIYVYVQPLTSTTDGANIKVEYRRGFFTFFGIFVVFYAFS